MAWIDELLAHTLVLVAHPDDECIAFGALLQRMREPLVVFAANGSPEGPYFHEKYGSREAFPAVYRQEAIQSMHAAGVKDVLCLADMPGGEHFVDQQLFRNLEPAFELLADLMRRRMIRAILTLAYEGGHPDHDSCSFLAAQLAKWCSIPCWEAPLYHRLPNGSEVFQNFIQHSGEEVEVHATPEEEQRKRSMCLAYSSQEAFLNRFDVTREIVRPQLPYDYTQPPHAGKVTYEGWQWQMTADEVSAAFSAFLKRSGVQEASR